MRIILFLSLLNLAFLSNTFFELKEQTNEKIIINFNLKNYEIEKKELGDVIYVPETGTRSLIGEPLLPSLSSFVKLDKYKSYDVQYNIISKKEINDIEIIPHQTFGDEVVDFQKNETIYTNNTSYPEKNLYISDRNSMRGNEFVNLEIVPFVYYPSQKKVIIIEELEIIITDTGEINQPISKDFPKSKTFERMIL